MDSSKLCVNSEICGFTINNIRYAQELKGSLYEMVHSKSGAKLMWLDNGEENKLFSVAFKTIPTDDTGVFHILEHSVLNGSEKYKAKEPFVELLKSSLNTFLNAMTYPDKTVYPVSSRNDKDFINLMRVYLDAVFRPDIYNNPNIFYQEGWHYEINEEGTKPKYKGVVLNEMKGAFSSAEDLIENEVQAMLFPDNAYRFCSGGNPEYITDLSYEEFLSAHSYYYHPSNARIYLDGGIDIEKTLSIISEEYLNKFEYQTIDTDIPYQNEVPATEREITYEISQEDEEAEQTYIVKSKIVGSWDERAKILGIRILANYLAGSNEAPLKRAILDMGLGQDISIDVTDGVMQPFLTVEVQNSEKENREAIDKLITKTVSDILEYGINKEELEATLNRYEFSLREYQEPKALIRNILALESWLFDGDPILYLTHDECFAKLKEGINNGFFEKLLNEVFGDINSFSTLIVLPSKTLGEEQRKKESEKLSSKFAQMSEEEKTEIINLNKKLAVWQQTPDTAENLATIPQLELSDLNPQSMLRTTEVYNKNGVTYLYHPSVVSGITYLNLYFNVADVKTEDIAYLSLMSVFMGSMPTEKYSVAELRRVIKKNLGQLTFSVDAYSVPGELDKTKLYFRASVSVLNEKIPEAIEIAEEVLLRTKWSDSKKLSELIKQYNEIYKQDIIGSGHSYSFTRALAHFSAESYCDELIGGYSAYKTISSLMNKPEKISEFLNAAKWFAQNAVNLDRLTIGQTSLKYDDISAYVMKSFSHGMSAPDKKEIHRAQRLIPRNEGISIPGGVNYAGLAFNFNLINKPYSGKRRVLAKILSLGYLWNEVRVKGGAYGTGFLVRENGNAAFYSYRDPNSLSTLDVYSKASDFIKEFVASDEKLDKYIIGTISDYEPLLSAKSYGKLCDSDYLREITGEMRDKEKASILSTKKEDLLMFCDDLKNMSEKAAVCVLGISEEIEKLNEKYNDFKSYSI